MSFLRLRKDHFQSSYATVHTNDLMPSHRPTLHFNRASGADEGCAGAELFAVAARHRGRVACPWRIRTQTAIRVWNSTRKPLQVSPAIAIDRRTRYGDRTYPEFRSPEHRMANRFGVSGWGRGRPASAMIDGSRGAPPSDERDRGCNVVRLCHGAQAFRHYPVRLSEIDER